MNRRSSNASAFASSLVLMLAVCLFFRPSQARGEAWTNAAGQAVEATLLSLDGELAVFRNTDGTRFTMPLASLSPASRQQALDAMGRLQVPERLKTDFNLCAQTLKRLGRLHDAGDLSDAAYEELRSAALARLHDAFERLAIPEKDRPRLLVGARNQ